MILPRAVLLSAVCAFCTLLTTWSGAHAAGASQTEAGLAHYSGGVTDLELKEVALRRPRHNFVLQVVSALSGGPIADAEVKITDIAG